MTTELTTIDQLKSKLAKKDYRDKFIEVLGEKKANGFISNIISIASNNELLAKAEPMSIISAAMVAATQWFERTLDDSANKRLTIPQAFLAVDAILLIWNNIMNGIVVYENRIHKHIMEELPFMATEYIIMEEVKAGGDRQEIHEVIRVHSMEASKKVKMEGKENDLIERIMNDDSLKLDKSKLKEVLDPKNFIGFAPIQTEEFVQQEIQPVLEKYADLIGLESELKV